MHRVPSVHIDNNEWVSGFLLQDRVATWADRMINSHTQAKLSARSLYRAIFEKEKALLRYLSTFHPFNNEYVAVPGSFVPMLESFQHQSRPEACRRF